MRQKWKDMRHEISRFMNKWYGAPMDELVLHHTRCLEQELAKIAETKVEYLSYNLIVSNLKFQSLIDLRDPLAGAIANVIQQITIGRNYMYQDQEFQTQLRDINAVVKEVG